MCDDARPEKSALSPVPQIEPVSETVPVLQTAFVPETEPFPQTAAVPQEKPGGGADAAAERARRMGPVALAFLGDAVFELRVRSYLIGVRHVPAPRLHAACVDFVNAASQARAAHALLPLLTEEEAGVFRRGRNANTVHVPKNATAADYRYATGLEALFGYLSLCGREERIGELFAAVVHCRAAGAAAPRPL